MSRQISRQLQSPWGAHRTSFTCVPGVSPFLIEQGGETEVTTTMRYETTEGRDGVLKSGMTDGVKQSYDRVAAIFETELVAREAPERKRA